MSPDPEEPDEFPNDPFDDELDAALMAAAELVSRTKTVGLDELELPIVDETAVWQVNVKRLGIREDE
jgi:hypothetical protein